MRTDLSLIGAMQSAVPGIAWPPLAAGEGAVLAALIHQLEQTQWLSADAIGLRQHEQLVKTAAHAEIYSAHFRRRMQAAGLHPEQLSTREGLRRLPVMRRRDVQSAGETLFCAQMPRAGFSAQASPIPTVPRKPALSRCNVPRAGCITPWRKA